MSGYLQLGRLWGIIAQGPFVVLIDILNSTFPGLFLKLFGVSQYDQLPLLAKTLYNVFYTILDVIPFVNGLTFADVTILNFMLGSGINAVIVFSIYKWISDIVK